MPRELTSEVTEFRRTSILSFLEGLISYATEKGLRSAICWVPPELLPIGFSLEDAAALRGIAALAVDPHWIAAGRTVADFFVPYLKRAREVARSLNVPLQVWLQGFRVPQGRERELFEGARIARGAGVDYLAIWHHQGMSALFPGDPQGLERTIDAILREVHRSRPQFFPIILRIL